MWKDRIAVDSYNNHVIHVFGFTGAHMYTFGNQGCGPGEFHFPSRLRLHPNGNLLVVEVGNLRVQEVTWAGTHVKFICSRTVALEQEFKLIAVSADGSLMAAMVAHGGKPNTVELMDGNTCGLVGRVTADMYRYGMEFSPDGRTIVLAGNQRYMPMAIDAGGLGTITPKFFGTESSPQYVEFTDGGDVVLCASTHGACVYCGKTLQLLRSWTWADRVAEVLAVQTHHGLLYVMCRVRPDWNTEVHVYV